MPHVIVEFSRNVADQLDLGATVNSLHRSLCDTGVLPVGAIKTRAIVHEHFAIGADGNGSALGFATAIVRIQPGWPLESEQLVARTAFDTLCEAVGSVDGVSVSVSVDVQHIHREASFSVVNS